jgi:hypothetical protein
MNRVNVDIRGIALLICAAAILAGSLMPENWGVDRNIDAIWFNAGHLPAYFVFSILFASWVLARTQITLVSLFVVGTIVCAFGFAVEFLQPLVGRSFSLIDLGLNALGVFGGMAVMLCIRARAVREIEPEVAMMKRDSLRVSSK